MDLIIFTGIFLLCLLLLGAFGWIFHQQRVIHTKNQEIFDLRLEKEKMATILEQKSSFFEEKMAMLENLKKEFGESFQTFIQGAVENLSVKSAKQEEGSKEYYKKSIESVEKVLDKLKEEMKELEKSRRGDKEALAKQLDVMLTMEKELKNETHNLSKALGRPKVRGLWGEMQLKKILEISGMLSYADFSEQSSIYFEEKRYQPDVIVHLPHNQDVIIDAKAPLDAFLEACNTEDPKIYDEKMKKHVSHLKSHIDGLSKKAYQKKSEKCVDFVVLFLPSEVFFSAALEFDPTLLEYAAKIGVVLTTPSTLLSLLKTIFLGWRDYQISQSMEKIQEIALEISKRMTDFMFHVETIGKHLHHTVGAYNKAVSSYEKRLLVSARKLYEHTSFHPPKELQVIEEMPIDPLKNFASTSEK